MSVVLAPADGYSVQDITASAHLGAVVLKSRPQGWDSVGEFESPQRFAERSRVFIVQRYDLAEPYVMSRLQPLSNPQKQQIRAATGDPLSVIDQMTAYAMFRPIGKRRVRELVVDAARQRARSWKAVSEIRVRLGRDGRLHRSGVVFKEER